MKERSEELIQKFSRRYVAVLVIVAGLLLLDQAVLQPLLVNLNLYAPVINLAGRQRMLSQRLMKGALAVERTPADVAQWRDELETSLQDWTRVHRGLQEGDRDLDLPGTASPSIQKEFATLEPHFAGLSEGVRTVLAAPTEADASIASMLQHERAYLETMDRIVRLFEDESRARVGQLRLLALGATGAALLLLAALYRLVVRPATRLIRSQVQHLSASETRFRLLIERMHDGLAILAPGGRVSYVNDRFCRILDRPQEQLLGQPLTIWVEGESRNRLVELLSRSGAASEEVLEIEWTVPGGRPCATLVAPGTNSDSLSAKSEPMTFLIVTDVTPLKVAERRIREARDALEVRVDERTRELKGANEALAHEAAEREQAEEKSRLLQTQLAHAARVTSLGELATGIAHEINQPLGAISNYAEALGVLAETPEAAAAEIRSIATRLRDAALRAGRIVGRMRNFVRSRSTPRSLERINPLIEEVLELCEPETREHGIEVCRRLAETDGDSVLVDPIQIQQVLVNLVRNAVQAMGAFPERERVLTIHTARNLDRILIDVEDTGPGFAADAIPHTFQPFQSTKADGLGMGLSISQTILASHGGELSAENASPRGARLTIVLPLAKAPLPSEYTDSLRRG